MRKTKYCGVCKTDTEHYETGGCVVCKRKSASAWRINNRERKAIRNKVWAENNREKARASSKKTREENKDKYLEKEAAYRAANKEKIANRAKEKRLSDIENARKKDAKKYAANPAKALSASNKWRRNNPEKSRAIWHNRRARKIEAGGDLSKGLAERLFKLQRGKCACGCGQPLGDDYHLDHRMPLALGGSNTDDNIQLLTATCNLKKGAKHPVEFMQSRGFLL